LSDEIHLFHVAFVRDNYSTRGIQSAEHVDDQLVGEASLALVKKVVE
jgi:hypothetical protein